MSFLQLFKLHFKCRHKKPRAIAPGVHTPLFVVNLLQRSLDRLCLRNNQLGAIPQCDHVPPFGLFRQLILSLFQEPTVLAKCDQNFARRFVAIHVHCFWLVLRMVGKIHHSLYRIFLLFCVFFIAILLTSPGPEKCDDCCKNGPANGKNPEKSGENICDARMDRLYLHNGVYGHTHSHRYQSSLNPVQDFAVRNPERRSGGDPDQDRPNRMLEDAEDNNCQQAQNQANHFFRVHILFHLANSFSSSRMWGVCLSKLLTLLLYHVFHFL